MLKYIFILLFIMNIKAYSNSNDYLWNKLIHYKKGQSDIISKQFFLSDKLHPSADDEYVSTINMLHSPLGEEVACNFPARYSYLRKYNLVPEFELSKCKDLTQFVDSFAKEKISLVFTSEYISAPASAFGHAMILFHDNNKSLELADTVHFAAKTSHDNFFTYTYKGLFGKYNSYFMREPFLKKIYEYNTKEQRFMYIYRLDFSKKEILFLIYHLYELRKATFKYYFLDNNCASQIVDLLDVINERRASSHLYYLPIDGLKDYKNKIIDMRVFTPLINKLDFLTSQMNQIEREAFTNIITQKKTPDSNLSNIVKEALVDYTTFNFRKFNKVYKNYNDIMSLNYQKNDIKVLAVNPLQKTLPSSLGIGWNRNNQQENILLSYRPILKELFDIQYNHIQESELTFFSADILINKEQTRIDKLDFLSLKSYSAITSFYKPLSWSLYSGLTRKNFKHNLEWDNELGVGYSYNFHTLSTNLLLNVGSSDSNFYIKPYFRVSAYLTQNFKLNLLSYYKKYNHQEYSLNQFSVTLKQKQFNYLLNYEKDSSQYGHNISLSLKYNF